MFLKHLGFADFPIAKGGNFSGPFELTARMVNLSLLNLQQWHFPPFYTCDLSGISLKNKAHSSVLKMSRAFVKWGTISRSHSAIVLEHTDSDLPEIWQKLHLCCLYRPSQPFEAQKSLTSNFFVISSAFSLMTGPLSGIHCARHWTIHWVKTSSISSCFPFFSFFRLLPPSIAVAYNFSRSCKIFLTKFSERPTNLAKEHNVSMELLSSNFF